jgi:hypothetical protein
MITARFSISGRYSLSLLVGALQIGLRADPANLLPAISITWPRGGEPVTYPNALKIKAQASDADGSVTQVQFFVETNLIGTATNPPFTVLWRVDPFTACDYCYLQLKAVAVDNLGARTESAPVSVHYSATRPPFTFLEILQPTNGTVLALGTIFDFSAELLGSSGEAAPVEFLVGDSLVGRVGELTSLTATTPPSSVTVSNLAEGEYRLTVRYPYNLCTCDWMSTTIRVVKLGVQSPRLTQDGRFQFDVLTSFSNRQTIVEASSNLLDWSPISTNHPSSNTFTFAESSPATNFHHFYRVVVPPE